MQYECGGREEEETASGSSASSELKVPVRLMVSDSDNSDWLFLKSLLPDLRQMDDEQKRRFKRCALELAEDILNKHKHDVILYREPDTSTEHKEKQTETEEVKHITESKMVHSKN